MERQDRKSPEPASDRPRGRALKSHDSLVAVLFAGRIATWLVEPARRMELSPNQITVASLFVTLFAASLIAFGRDGAWVVAAILIQVGFVLDCLDGQLARATGKASDFGRYLDSMTDLIKVFVLISAMSLSLLRQGFGAPASGLGAMAFFGYLLCEYHTQLVRQFPQRSQEEYERKVGSWKAWLQIGGQKIDLAFAIGEVLMTITIAVFLGRLGAGLMVLLVVTPLQYLSYAVRFWKLRHAG